MKILIANYRYFISGGPERYMFNVSSELTRRGHEVIPFSINYRRNHPTPYSRYFVEPLSNIDEVTFREQKNTPANIGRSLTRLFYAPEVERAVLRLAADTKPQVAYVLRFLRKLSPSLLVGLKKAGLPIVVRLSDYGILCPNEHCELQESPCQVCIRGNLWPSIRHRCVQNSVVASVLNALATRYHRFKSYFDLIDVFVPTNYFLYRMMLEAGFPERRLRCIPTFVDLQTFQPEADFEKENYLAYVGRLTRKKGVHLLIEALVLLWRKRPDAKIRLKIMGSGEKDYVALLKRMVEQAGLQGQVQFLGELDAEGVSRILRRAQLSVVPSLCFENLPNAILESYACGTPVLASDLGSLAESVVPGETGYLFQGGDAHDLAEKLEYCFDRPAMVKGMAAQARERAEKVYAPEQHLIRLEQLFNGI